MDPDVGGGLRVVRSSYGVLIEFFESFAVQDACLMFRLGMLWLWTQTLDPRFESRAMGPISSLFGGFLV